MDQILATIESILLSLNSYFTVAAILVFLHCFYDPGFQWHKKKAIWFAVITVLSLATIITDIFHELPPALFWTVAVAELILRVVLILYDYQGKRWKGFLRYICMLLLISICMGLITDSGSQYLFRDYDSSKFISPYSQSLPVYTLYTAFFAAVFFYLNNKVYKPGITFPWTKRERTFVICYTLFALLTVCITAIFGKQSPQAYFILGIAYVVLMVLVVVFFYYLRISRYFQEQTRYQEDYIQAELAHFQQYKQTQEETARFRHDARNNLLCLNDLLGAGKTQEATEYLQSLLQVTETLRPKYVSGDEILDSILAVKSDIMTQNEIDFRFDGVVAGGLGWKAIDICSVFANALDNAIEACMHLPADQRQITMELKATAQFFMVRLTNPVLEDVDTSKLFKKMGGYTSKSQGMHGIGTYNMKRTVEAYGGILDAQCADKQFTLEIMIHKQ